MAGKPKKNPPKHIMGQLLQLNIEKRYEELSALALKIIGFYPDSYNVWNILGIAYLGQKDFKNAIRSFQKALKFKPNYYEALNNLGNAYNNNKNFASANKAYNQALCLQPQSCDVLNNLASVAIQQENLDEAEIYLNRALKIKPDHPEALYNLGNIFWKKGDLKEAKLAYQKSVKYNPKFGQAFHNLGAVFMELERLDAALESFGNALSTEYRNAELLHDVGVALRQKGFVDESINALQKGLDYKPGCPELTFNLALSYLAKGDFLSGFNLYESRYFREGSTILLPRKSLIWDGIESLEGKHFFVYEEQGFGDILQFCRFLPKLKEKGAKITFKVTEGLHHLLSSLDKDINLLSNFSKLCPFDFECSLLSLPYLLGVELQTISSPNQYLYADQKKVSEWAGKLDKSSFNVGICWQGSEAKADSGRFFPLSLFEGISKIPNVRLISLQKGKGEEQLNDISFELKHFTGQIDNDGNSFSDTAAIIKNCDLILTPDCSIAHLAGALGQPTWIILKKVPNWRWCSNFSKSPWYPKTSLYRQEIFEDWEQVFARVEIEMTAILAQQN